MSTPADPKLETFRLWVRRTPRSKWELACAGTKEECDAEQQRRSWRGYSDFYLTQRIVDPNTERFAR